MEGNRISFEKEYTELEALAIITKTKRILRELEEMEVGPSAFKLNDEVTVVYNPKSSNWEEPTLYYEFRDRDKDEVRYSFPTGYKFHRTSESLFVTKWEEIKKEIHAEKKAFEEKEKDVFDIEYTREDGIDAILEAFENGANVDISKYLELPDLTDEEKLVFIRDGYGYDLYFEPNQSCDVQSCIERYSNYSPFEINKKLKEWVEENPEKCILPENRNKVN